MDKDEDGSDQPGDGELILRPERFGSTPVKAGSGLG